MTFLLRSFRSLAWCTVSPWTLPRWQILRSCEILIIIWLIPFYITNWYAHWNIWWKIYLIHVMLWTCWANSCWASICALGCNEYWDIYMALLIMVLDMFLIEKWKLHILVMLIGMVKLTIERALLDYVFGLISSMISWSHKKQTSITLSMVEAEYIVARSNYCEDVWLHKLFVGFFIRYWNQPLYIMIRKVGLSTLISSITIFRMFSYVELWSLYTFLSISRLLMFRISHFEFFLLMWEAWSDWECLLKKEKKHWLYSIM